MDDAHSSVLHERSFNSSLSGDHAYCNLSLWDKLDVFYIFDFSSVSSQANSSDGSLTADIQSVLYVTRWLVICTGFPLTVLAISAFYSMVRGLHVFICTV